MPLAFSTPDDNVASSQRKRRIARIPWITGVARITGIAGIAWIASVGLSEDMVEAIAIENRPKIATVRVEYIAVTIGQPSDPIAVGRVDEVAQSERDPASTGVKKILYIHGNCTIVLFCMYIGASKIDVAVIYFS
jgi:hypothetical protein